jgi:hypothetical protein
MLPGLGLPFGLDGQAKTSVLLTYGKTAFFHTNPLIMSPPGDVKRDIG